MKIKNKKERREALFKKIKFILFLFIATYIFIAIYTKIENVIIAKTNEVTKMQGQNIINKTINETMKTLLTSSNISNTDFYTTTVNEKGEIKTIEINTILINEICTLMSETLLKSFENEQNKSFQIPVFSLFNSTLLTKTGPLITLSLLPVANVVVTPNTEFVEAGINQTNLRISLDISVVMQMTNPITSDLVIETRNVPLVNTIINGNVPNYSIKEMY